LNTWRDSAKFKPAQSAATSHVQWGRWGLGAEGATLYFASLVAASRP